MAVRVILTMTFPNETAETLREKVIREAYDEIKSTTEKLDEIDADDVAAYVRAIDYDTNVEFDEEWVNLD